MRGYEIEDIPCAADLAEMASWPKRRPAPGEPDPWGDAATDENARQFAERIRS